MLENHHWRSAVGILHESGLFDHLPHSDRCAYPPSTPFQTSFISISIPYSHIRTYLLHISICHPPPIQRFPHSLIFCGSLFLLCSPVTIYFALLTSYSSHALILLFSLSLSLPVTQLLLLQTCTFYDVFFFKAHLSDSHE